MKIIFIAAKLNAVRSHNGKVQTNKVSSILTLLCVQ